MTDQTRQLAELIASRICHDLVNPVGAVMNGLELMELQNESESEESWLIRQAANCASARIAFLRIAFGRSSGFGRFSQAEVIGIAEEYFDGRRISFIWDLSGNFNTREVHQLFLALMCLASALPKGGQIHVGCDRDGWRLEATGEIREDHSLWKALNDKEPIRELRSGDAHFEMARLAFGGGPRPVEQRLTAENVVLKFARTAA